MFTINEIINVTRSIWLQEIPEEIEILLNKLVELGHQRKLSEEYGEILKVAEIQSIFIS